VLTGCGHHAAQTQTVQQFERAKVAEWAHEQWPKVYDTLYPAQQETIAEKDFAHCMGRGQAVTKSLDPEASTERLASARVTGRRRIAVPGSNVRVMATVVSYLTSIVQFGKRSTDPEPLPDYLIKLNGQWRWVDPATNYKQLCGPVQATSGIRVGYGIGGVTIHEPERQVIGKLGTPAKSQPSVTFGFHTHLLTFTTPSIVVQISDERTRQYKRVVSVWTYSRSERTPEGAGVGDTESRLHQLFQLLQCDTVKLGRRNCVLLDLQHQNATAFQLRHGRVYLVQIA
jgi:hypothetical protein